MSHALEAAPAFAMESLTSDLFDEHGWFVGAVSPWRPDEALSVLSPEPSGAFPIERLRHHASRFFQTELTLLPEKRYDVGAPRSDAATLVLTRREWTAPSRVLVQTVSSDRAPLVRARADAAVVAMGGAGFDVLIGRCQRVWQFRGEPGAADAAALLAATVVASVVLGPVLASDGKLLGVKSARVRLEQLGLA